MFSGTRHGEKFLNLEDDPNPSLREYVYRWDRINKRRTKPPVYKGRMFRNTLDYLRDQFHAHARCACADCDKTHNRRVAFRTERFEADS